MAANHDVATLYDSVAAMAADLAETRYPFDRPTWYGAHGTQDALDKLAQGERSGSPLIERILSIVDKVDATADRTGAREWTPSVVGPRPNVGAVLAGSPYTSYMLHDTAASTTPVRIVVDPAVSASVEPDELAARGAALAALVMVMSEQRAVELHLATAMRPTGDKHGAAWRVRVDTAPLDVSGLAFMLCSPCYARAVQFSTFGRLLGQARAGGNISWHPCRPGAERERYMRDKLELAPQDIVIQGLYGTDARLMATDPVAWVHAQLEHQREALADAD